MLYIFGVGLVAISGLLAGISLREKYYKHEYIKDVFEAQLECLGIDDLRAMFALNLYRGALGGLSIYRMCQILHEIEYRNWRNKHEN